MTNTKQSEASRAILDDAPKACMDELAAVEFLERMRWPEGVCCPRCGDVNVYAMKGRRSGKREAHYRWRCRGCKRQFSVRTATVMEQTNIPLRHWCMALWLHTSGRKGVAATQISRMTGVSYKWALFMCHRIRHAMTQDGKGKLKGEVEADEAYIGGRFRRKNRHARKPKFNQWDKTPVLGIVQRGGELRAKPVKRITGGNVRHFVKSNVDESATFCTDDLRLYREIGRGFKGGHIAVEHQIFEYVRYPRAGSGTTVVGHTNTLESFWSHLKRKLDGVHHSVSERHLGRYVDEAVFNWNTRGIGDGERLRLVVKKTEGKRLVYAVPPADAA